MATLKSVTAYNGRFILEYSEVEGGKARSRFAIQPPPDETVTAGDSLREVQRVIDRLPKVPNPGVPIPVRHPSIRSGQ
jgi:hypothetical protein